MERAEDVSESVIKVMTVIGIVIKIGVGHRCHHDSARADISTSVDSVVVRLDIAIIVDVVNARRRQTSIKACKCA